MANWWNTIFRNRMIRAGFFSNYGENIKSFDAPILLELWIITRILTLSLGNHFMKDLWTQNPN